MKDLEREKDLTEKLSYANPKQVSKILKKIGKLKEF